MVDIALWSLTASRASGLTWLAKARISWFPGFKNQLYSIFGLDQEVFQQWPVAKVCFCSVNRVKRYIVYMYHKVRHLYVLHFIVDLFKIKSTTRLSLFYKTGSNLDFAFLWSYFTCVGNLVWLLLCLDLQNVNITLRILFRPVPSQLPNIFMTLGIDYDERVLPSIVNEVLKAVVVSCAHHRQWGHQSSCDESVLHRQCSLGCLWRWRAVAGAVWRVGADDVDVLLQAQYDASELITQRERVSQKIQEELIARASQFGFVMDDMSIVSIFLPCLDTVN